MVSSSPLTEAQLRSRARSTSKSLLTLAAPSDFGHIVPEIATKSNWLRSDMADIDRRLTEVLTGTGNPEHCSFRSLAAASGPRHLVIAPPGGGKSHSAWALANQLQASNDLPILIDVAAFDTADDVLEFVQSSDALTPEQLRELGGLVFILDGWSSFPADARRNRIAERRKLLAAIGSAKVITTGRKADEGDHAFRVWALDPLSAEWCSKAVSRRLKRLPSSILELVRQPLMMLLWAGTEGEGGSAGELLNDFQQICTRAIPDREKLFRVVARACLSTQLKSSRRDKAVFDSEVAVASRELALENGPHLVDRLGTLTGYGMVVRPFHDLYWSWLVGVGALQQTAAALRETILSIPLRESLRLSAESKRAATTDQFELVLSLDIGLASFLLSGLSTASCRAYEQETLTLLRSSAPAHAYVGVKAALMGAVCVPQALSRLSELRDAGCWWPDLSASIDVDRLWGASEHLAEWFALGPKGTDDVLEALQSRGDERWASFCETLAQRGALALDDAVATAAACAPTLSVWARQALPGALAKAPWKFRSAAARGWNRDLALEALRQYETFADTEGSWWIHLNRIIVGCGDDALFESVCSKYVTMNPHMQELLSYAINELGEPWRTVVQQAVFRRGTDVSTRGEIFETMSRQISPDDARRWASSPEVGVSILGWRALAAGQQNGIVPELIKALPESFEDLHYVPALIAVQELLSAPESLASELWRRLRGNIEPKAMDDFIRGLARVDATGLVQLGDWLMRGQALKLPSYHFSVFLRSLFEWERRTGKHLMVQLPDGEHFSLAITLFGVRLRADCEEAFFDRICRAARGTNLATMLLHEWANGNDKLIKGVHAVGEVEEYDAVVAAGVWSRATEVVPFQWSLFLSIFAGCIGTFPETAIAKVPVESAPLNELVRATARSPVPAHRSLHERLARLVLERNESNFVLEDLAKIVACHGAQAATEFLFSLEGTGEPNAYAWLLRRAEHHLGVPMMSATGMWLRSVQLV